jgi:DNA polymerase elongation subunit (family B)
MSTMSNAFGFDIETDTATSGLDPRVSAVISIAIWSPELQVVLAGEPEWQLLFQFARLLDGMAPGVALGWNSSVFDVPFISTRAGLCGVDMGWRMVPDATIVPKYNFTPPHTTGYRVMLGRHHHADISYAYQAHAAALDIHNGLKPVCRSLGIEMIEVDREHTHLLSADELAAYNLSDSRGTCLLGERLGPELEHWVDRLDQVAA